MTSLIPPLHFQTARPENAHAIAALLDLAFGPGRFAKTAARLRENNQPVEALSLLAFEGDDLRASVQFWPIMIGQAPALLLGPLAVDPQHRGKGIGLELMAHGLDKARGLGHALVLLVGDAPYYAKVGFVPAPPGALVMPGPVDPARLLISELIKGAMTGVGGKVKAVPVLPGTV